jgi:hypothetical protein
LPDVPVGADEPVTESEPEPVADPELLPDFVPVFEFVFVALVLPVFEVVLPWLLAEDVALLVLEPVDEACDAEPVVAVLAVRASD